MFTDREIKDSVRPKSLKSLEKTEIFWPKESYRVLISQNFILYFFVKVYDILVWLFSKEVLYRGWAQKTQFVSGKCQFQFRMVVVLPFNHCIYLDIGLTLISTPSFSEKRNVYFLAIRRRENGWYDEEHPLVFLFLGSSGIGNYLLKL